MSISKGIALITGSAQGIGRGIALRLARDGFDIGLNDVLPKQQQLRAVAEEIEKTGRRAHLVPADVTVEEEVQGMVQGVAKELGGLDVMVANAGVITRGTGSSTADAKLEEWERIMAVNARGPFLCYKYAAQQMIKQNRGGRIIGASSIFGKEGFAFNAAYCSSKFAVRALTQSAASELGRYNITVNAYAPGFIQTPLTESFQKNIQIPESDREIFNSITGRINMRPIKHQGQPEDIASIVSYLVSKEAHFITGQCITVDGGIIMS